MNNVEVLISAMNQKDSSIFKRTNIQSDALMINQCDDENYWEESRNYGLLKIFSTKERGLSNSRNMAINKAEKKYALLCDDDEYLYKDYPKIIEDAFANNPKADVICFQVKRAGKKYSRRKSQLNYWSSLKIGSWQISFNLESIRRENVLFDPKFGSGTPVGSGEENIFLYDCLKKGLKIYYEPICIGEVAQLKSNWFRGFDKTYFFNRGIIIKRLMGIWGIWYCLFFVISKYKRYKSEISAFLALKNILKGFVKK